MSRHLLIDGDVLVYESAFAAQRNRYTVYVLGGETRTFQDAKTRDAWLKAEKLVPEQYTVEKHLDVLDEHLALVICKNKLNALLEVMNADSHGIYLTGKGNFRDEVATLAPYKGGRPQEKPVHFQACREWYENHKHSVVTNGQEADDAIGIAQTERYGSAIIASIDKDLRQIYGSHVEWAHQGKPARKYHISPDASDRWFWLQMLMGDATDNIPGIEGIGPAKAKRALPDDVFDRGYRADAVADMYEKQYGPDWLTWANEVGKLLWIRRAPDQLWDWNDYVDNRMVEG